ncbi:hypothetical protein [Leeuwenhoekiella sp. NPDC079379]|uniref:hypothetical protein n=1 Tax=Leeuwenhoekiella sp. NPDC079379 TaxID=3364122 RepID=UPI0037CC83A2
MKEKYLIVILIFAAIVSCKNPGTERSQNLVLKANVEQLEPNAKEAVKKWDGYLALERTIILISNTNALNAVDMRNKLAENCDSMTKNIPENLEFPEIKDQVRKVKEEVNEFYAEVNRDEIRERVVEDHLKTIYQAFDTLNKEINHIM